MGIATAGRILPRIGCPQMPGQADVVEPRLGPATLDVSCCHAGARTLARAEYHVTISPLEVNCAAILFDLDGVLIDSTECVERHWRAWAAEHSMDADEILHIAHGVRNVDTIRRIAPHLDAAAEAELFAAGEVADTEGVRPVEGAVALLSGLEQGRWAIVTSCSDALALARIRTAGLPLPIVLVTGSDVTHGKPEPEPFLLAASRLGVAAADCVVVEDAPAGVEAGKRAGMRVIGLAFTYRPGQLRASGADIVIDQLTDLAVLPTTDGRLVLSARKR